MSKTSCKASSRQVSPGRVVKNETEIPPAGRIVKKECLAVDWSRRGRDSPQSGAASAVLFLPGDRGLLSGAFRRPGPSRVAPRAARDAGGGRTRPYRLWRISSPADHRRCQAANRGGGRG